MTTGILTALGAVLFLILIDTLLGVILGIKAGRFDVRKLPQFLVTNLLPYGGALIILGLAACLGGEYGAEIIAIFYAAAAATAGKFLAEIKDKVKQIFGEIPIDSSVKVGNIYISGRNDADTVIKAILEAVKKETSA